MNKTARLSYGHQSWDIPVIQASTGECALDISRLRAESGLITLDPGYHNTGAASSSICYIDSSRGKLYYRGYDVEELAEKSSFTETVYLLIYGNLPDEKQKELFRQQLTEHALIHQGMLHFFVGLPPTAHPMGILSSMINALALYYPQFYVEDNSPETFSLMTARLISKVRTIAAFSYKKSRGEPFVYPEPHRSYCDNFLHMMFHSPAQPYESDPLAVEILNAILIAHAEHEQNCSTSTVQLVGSSRANLYASVCAGICALWGSLHGGVDLRAMEVFKRILNGEWTVRDALEKTKNPHDAFSMPGFGHPVYLREDPRARILKKQLKKLQNRQGITDPLFQIALELEDAVYRDDYFLENHLLPNMHFYSGLLYRALGIPENMFTVLFTIGRLPGWIAHWKEMHEDPDFRLYRPRQVYTGPLPRPYTPLEKRHD